MNTHVMSLNPDALKLIKNGIKTPEMRLYDEKRQKIEKGDYIIFIDIKGENKKLNVKVKEFYRYNSFDELYKEFDKIKLGYGKDDEALPVDMEMYYTKENTKKYGVIGIEVEVIN